MSAAHHKHKPAHDKHEQATDSPNGSPTDPEESQQEIPIPKTITITSTELDCLKKDLAEAKDKYLRGLAESENVRKRLQKEKQESVQYAIQSLINDFLNPIDHMENALGFAQQMSEDVKHWALGFQMILTQFKDVLNANGVNSFTSEGTPFDPHRHEAIEMKETDKVSPGIVVEEIVKGYAIGDKIIRPARVKVSKKPGNQTDTQLADDDQNETQN